MRVRVVQPLAWGTRGKRKRKHVDDLDSDLKDIITTYANALAKNAYHLKLAHPHVAPDSDLKTFVERALSSNREACFGVVVDEFARAGKLARDLDRVLAAHADIAESDMQETSKEMLGDLVRRDRVAKTAELRAIFGFTV